MNVLVIGPSARKSKGGMSTVIGEMENDKEFCQKYHMDFFESYIDGNRIKVLVFSLYAFIKFIITGKAKKYDIYHIHAASYGSTFRKSLYVKAIKRNNKKVVFHIHGAEYMEFYDALSEKKKKYVVDCLKKSDIVIALSDDWKNKFENKFGINNCIAIENGINMDDFKSAISDVDKYTNTFVSLGRLGHRKGTYDILEAVEKVYKDVPDILVYLGGDGDIEKVKEIVNKKNLEKNVKVLGWVGYKQKIELLKKSSVLLLPSYNEGLPMAILEAMACGKGVISTRVGAIPEVISEDNGILINAGDVDGLANALLKMCQDSEYLSHVSKNNIIKISEKYDMNIMHSKIEKAYKTIS